MSKYILHGGRGPRDDIFKDSIYLSEIFKGLTSPVKILLVYFAKDKSDWPAIFEEEKNFFSQQSTNKEIRLLIADEDKNILENQIKQADVIYLRGGKTPQLKAALEEVNNLKDLFKDKVVFGSSAGAYVLGKYYYSNSQDSIFKGLNILPIKVFCHYNNSKKDKLDRLKKYQEELEVVVLPENKYIVKND